MIQLNEGLVHILYFNCLSEESIMKKSTFILITLLLNIATLLSGCASNNLTAPCPSFGVHCDKTPINSWNANY